MTSKIYNLLKIFLDANQNLEIYTNFVIQIKLIINYNNNSKIL